MRFDLEIGNIAPQELAMLNRDLDKMVNYIGNDAANEARIVARNLCVHLAEATMPSSDSQKKAFEKAISADLASMIGYPSEVYNALKREDPRNARSFMKAMVSKNNTRALRILRSSGTRWRSVQRIGGAVQKDQYKRSRGRTTGRPDRRRAPLQVLNYGVKTRDSFEKKLHKRIGKGASGWAHAAKSLGSTRGIPRWKGVGQHKQQLGRGEKVKTLLFRGIQIENTARHIRYVTHSGKLRSAVKSAAIAMNERLNIAWSRKNWNRR